jgi:hypothetical protein
VGDGLRDYLRQQSDFRGTPIALKLLSLVHEAQRLIFDENQGFALKNRLNFLEVAVVLRIT